MPVKLYIYMCVKCWKKLAYRKKEPEKCGKCGSTDVNDLQYDKTIVLD